MGCSPIGVTIFVFASSVSDPDYLLVVVMCDVCGAVRPLSRGRALRGSIVSQTCVIKKKISQGILLSGKGKEKETLNPGKKQVKESCVYESPPSRVHPLPTTQKTTVRFDSARRAENLETAEDSRHASKCAAVMHRSRLRVQSTQWRPTT